MATYTDQQMLDKVREGIFNIVQKGQSYSINGRTYTRQDLGDLESLEKYYQKRVSAGGGRNTNYYAFRRGT